jgi:TPR repeat protein
VLQRSWRNKGNKLRISQCYHGRYLRDGTDISKDLISTAHYCKLSADQGNADSQRCYGRNLRDKTDISKDLISAGHYFKL